MRKSFYFFLVIIITIFISCSMPQVHDVDIYNVSVHYNEDSTLIDAFIKADCDTNNDGKIDIFNVEILTPHCRAQALIAKELNKKISGVLYIYEESANIEQIKEKI